MIDHILGIPTEQVLALPSVRLIGDGKAEIYNYKGLVSVEETCVCIATRVGDLMLEGSRLEVHQITKDYVTVRGVIRRIYYKELKELQ